MNANNKKAVNNKPLQRDLSFWIVAVVLVGAASALQLYFGIPWFQQRLALVKPAPRSQPAIATAARTAVNLDMRKKTYGWQTPQFMPHCLEDTPPQVVLTATEYTPPSGGWSQSRSNKVIGIRMSAQLVVQAAYNWPSQRRMVLSDALPPGEFDFIANLPAGATEALQAEVKKQWGLVAEREIRQTNVLVLELDHAGAPGLKPDTNSSATYIEQPGSIHFAHTSISFLVSRLESALQLPVLDRTGLTGTYDVQLQLSMIQQGAPGQVADRIEQLRAPFLSQFGLNLITTNAEVEMLVVKKANP